ncbi:MAG TPA: hypothetical protein PLP29_08695 [Candidatus Ozemobacteraceae bacterium]|nr:hypothetical protein [Candidatus Ozemobacteraceae bacterium]
MKQKFRLFVVWMMIFSLLAEGYAPLFAESSATDPLRVASDRYQATYKEYSTAVSSGAPLEEIQAKFNTYMEAYTQYQRLVTQTRGDTAVTNAPAETAGTTSAGETSSPATTADDAASVAVPADADTASGTLISSKIPQTAKGWFGKIFTHLKEKFLGKAGSKEMPLLEKIAWNIGKAIVPSFAVMLTTALLAPFSPVAMIVGGIVVGAAMGGLMTYAYEKRMNARYREIPKEDAKIWRDVTVSAAVEAVMAPFNLMTGGLFGMAGPTVGSAVTRVALTQAALGFTGSAISSGVGGVVKNIWARNVFHYPEKIAANEARIDAVLDAHVKSGQPLSETEIAELNRLQTEIDQMKGESYSSEDFTKDLKRAAVGSVISGFMGSVVSDKLYSYDKGRWADRLSIKLFGSTAQGKALSSVVSTIPTNFLGGMAGAELEKSFIRDDIKDLRSEQAKYAAGSPAYEYYQGVLTSMQSKHDSIKSTEAGFNSAANSVAVRAGQLSVQALKYNIYDAPKARKAAVEDLYRMQNKDWKKANEKYEAYQKVVEGKPELRNYRNPITYAKALQQYNQKASAARAEWMKQCVTAQNNEKLPENIALKEQVSQKFDREVKLNQMLELGRLSGGEKHVEAMMAVLKENNPEYAALPQDQLRYKAITAIARSYDDKYAQCTTKVNGLNETMKKYEDYKAGRIQLTEDEARVLEGRKSLISPSQYKAALVEQKVYEMKSNNVRWDVVEKRMPEILTQAEAETLNQYGGWNGVLVSEMYANGLARYKYDPEGRVNFAAEMKKLAAKIPGMVESGIVNDYKTEVNNAITGAIIPKITSGNAADDFLKTFTKSAITTGAGNAIDTVYNTSKERIMSGFKR